MKKKEISSRVILIDIGSTIIKYYIYDEYQIIIESGFYQREYKLIVDNQVIEILENKLNWEKERDSIHICSSANGGITVGVIGYTKRFSVEWASKAAFNAGANVLWATDIEGWNKSQKSPVDILVVTGGADDSPIDRQIDWLYEISLMDLRCETVITAGNKLLNETYRKYWPKSIQTENVIGEDFRWQGEPLTKEIRESYLRDLVLKKGISRLRTISSVPILPTPAIVQDSYECILNGKTSLHLPIPLLLLDIGGATTDVYYGGELIAEIDGNLPRPSINRHVFTFLGVQVSRHTVIEKLTLSENLSEFLRVIEPLDAEGLYIRLREGENDWITTEFLAEACCYLALKECAEGLSSGHRLELTRVASIAITGGASQICETEKIERILSLCGINNVKVYLDKDYKIWVNGMFGTNLNKEKSE